MAAASKTVAHAGIYTLGNLLRNMVSIIMLPIYTRYLTPADYGTVELLTMLIDIAGLIFGMKMGDAIFRFYMTAESDEARREVIATAFWLAGGLNAVGVLFIVAGAPLVALALFGGGDESHLVLLFAATLLLQGIIELVLVFIRAQQRPWLYIGVSVARLTLQLSLNIWFIVVQELHVEGVIYASLIANGIAALALCAYALSRVGTRFSRRYAGAMIRYSAPLVLAGIGAFYLGFGDRYFLRVFTDMATVGIYALGYKFGFVLLYFTWDPFFKIWESQRWEVYRQSDARLIFQRTFLGVSLFAVTTALCISLFVEELLRVMSDPAYWGAAGIVPVVLAAYLLHGFANFASFGALLHKRTLLITWSTWIAVAVITVGYLTLIPLFGAQGAAWATVIAFAVRLYWIHEKSRALYDMQLPWRRVALLIACAVVVYLASLFAPHNWLASLLVKLGLLAAFLAALLRLPVFSAEEKRAFFGMVRERLPRRLGGRVTAGQRG